MSGQQPRFLWGYDQPLLSHCLGTYHYQAAKSHSLPKLSCYYSKPSFSKMYCLFVLIIVAVNLRLALANGTNVAPYIMTGFQADVEDTVRFTSIAAPIASQHTTPATTVPSAPTSASTTIISVAASAMITIMIDPVMALIGEKICITETNTTSTKTAVRPTGTGACDSWDVNAGNRMKYQVHSWFANYNASVASQRSCAQLRQTYALGARQYISNIHNWCFVRRQWHPSESMLTMRRPVAQTQSCIEAMPARLTLSSKLLEFSTLA